MPSQPLVKDFFTSVGAREPTDDEMDLNSQPSDTDHQQLGVGAPTLSSTVLAELATPSPVPVYSTPRTSMPFAPQPAQAKRVHADVDLSMEQPTLTQLWSFMAGQFEDLGKRFTKTDDNIAKIGKLAVQHEKRINEHDTCIKDVKQGLAAVVADVRGIRDTMEDDRIRVRRLSELLVRGLPVGAKCEKAVLLKIATAICTALGVNVQPSSFLTVSVFSQKRTTAAVVAVRFRSIDMRNEVFERYMTYASRTPLTTRHLGFNADGKVFLTDHLSPIQARLKFEARKLLLGKVLSRVTVRDGFVAVSVTGSSSLVILRDPGALYDIPGCSAERISGLVFPAAGAAAESSRAPIAESASYAGQS